MRPILFSALAALCLISCNKSSNNYSVTDHTVGMLLAHNWTGNTNGYRLGDTVLPMATVHTPWPKAFNRNIADTLASVFKVNGFAVSAFGTTMEYRSTDSVAKYLRYDTVISGKLSASLYFFYSVDSMMFVLDRVDSFSAAANEYYQVHDSLHTKHS